MLCANVWRRRLRPGLMLDSMVSSPLPPHLWKRENCLLSLRVGSRAATSMEGGLVRQGALLSALAGCIADCGGAAVAVAMCSRDVSHLLPIRRTPDPKGLDDKSQAEKYLLWNGADNLLSEELGSKLMLDNAALTAETTQGEMVAPPVSAIAPQAPAASMDLASLWGAASQVSKNPASTATACCMGEGGRG